MTRDAGSAATSTATTTGRTRGSATRRPTRSRRPGKIYKTSRPDLSTPAGSTITANYDEGIPDEERHRARFDAVLAYLTGLPLEWRNSRFRNLADLYGLSG